MRTDETVKSPQLARTRPESLPLGSHGPDVWFQRAQEAGTLSEVLVCLNQVYALDPHFTRAKEMRCRMVWRLLEANPFLAYQDETESLYRVWSKLNLELIVPKGRAIVETFPPTTEKPLAPITAVRTLLIYLKKPLEQGDRLRVFVILFLSAVLWMAGIFLSLLFILHLFS